VYVGGDIDLDKLKVPKGIKLVDITAASARARKGIESNDQSVRGWSAGVIAHLDARDPENQKAVEKLLADKNDWVRLNAAGAIPEFGQHAKSALPALKSCLESENKGLKEAAQKAVESIEAAPDQTARDREYRAAVEKIRAFVAAHK
jgi:HEAT repeat protein